MSDDMNVTSTETGASSSSTGKIIAVIAGLGLLGIIAGVAAAIILSGIGDQVVDGPQGQVEQSVSESPGSASTESTGIVAQAAAPAPEVMSSELFTFRDIFDPLIKPQPEPSAAGTTTAAPSATDTETPYAQGVLYLDDIENIDGVMKAVLRYNGQTYKLAAGESMPGTPWQVFSVSRDSVTMLYGDNRVTLVRKQSISK